jgi:apolipoprotein D and lipocalin family protein
MIGPLQRTLLFTLPALFLLAGCTATKPSGVVTVEPFDGSRYMGRWYEIARLDHRFERGLTNVTAEYSLQEDGKISVINRGFKVSDNEWREATGKAEFVEGSNKGRLKVSFFGPFYSGYNIIALDEEYRHALVTGEDRDYLWLLSRTPTMPEEVKDDYLQRARVLGYDTSALIWVEHDR